MKIADFLQRDFGEEENRNAAAKNAFALLGQHRQEEWEGVQNIAIV